MHSSVSTETKPRNGTLKLILVFVDLTMQNFESLEACLYVRNYLTNKIRAPLIKNTVVVPINASTVPVTNMDTHTHHDISTFRLS